MTIEKVIIKNKKTGATQTLTAEKAESFKQTRYADRFTFEVVKTPPEAIAAKAAPAPATSATQAASAPKSAE